MAPQELEPEEDVESEETQEEEREPLSLEVKIDSPSACQRHVTVTVPREDIERYFDKAFGDLMPTAAVPGFRAGRAPRKLVEHRFRKDVADQVKGSLLMDSLSQMTDEQKLAAISEPDFDPHGGRAARRRAADLRIRYRSAAGIRLAEMEGLDDRAPRAPDHRQRHRTGIAAAVGLSRAIDADRRAGLAGRLRHGEFHVQGRR